MLFRGATHCALSAIAEEHLSLGPHERDGLRALFDQIEKRMKLDTYWRELRAKLLPAAKGARRAAARTR